MAMRTAVTRWGCRRPQRQDWLTPQSTVGNFDRSLPDARSLSKGTPPRCLPRWSRCVAEVMHCRIDKDLPKSLTPLAAKGLDGARADSINANAFF